MAQMPFSPPADDVTVGILGHIFGPIIDVLVKGQDPNTVAAASNLLATLFSFFCKADTWSRIHDNRWWGLDDFLGLIADHKEKAGSDQRKNNTYNFEIGKNMHPVESFLSSFRNG